MQTKLDVHRVRIPHMLAVLATTSFPQPSWRALASWPCPGRSSSSARARVSAIHRPAMRFHWGAPAGIGPWGKECTREAIHGKPEEAFANVPPSNAHEPQVGGRGLGKSIVFMKAVFLAYCSLLLGGCGCFLPKFPIRHFPSLPGTGSGAGFFDPKCLRLSPGSGWDWW